MTVAAQSGEFGLLTDLVAVVGSLIAAAIAIGRAWRGREKWEPAEQDIPAGAERVGNLCCAALIVVLWVNYGPATSDAPPIQLVVALLTTCVLALFAYSWMIGAKVYDVKLISKSGHVESSRVIGGFKLTKRANDTLAEEDITVEELLRGVQYRPDRVWTRESRATAKVVFIALSISLTVSGTLALATAALALDTAGSTVNGPTTSPTTG